MKLVELFEKINLFELNVINQKDIDNFLSSFQQKTNISEVKNWIGKNVKNYILNNQNLNHQVNPQSIRSAEDWLKKAIDRGDSLFKFEPTDEFITKLDHIVDWLNSDQAKEYLPSLFKVSFDQAVSLSEKWTKSLMNKASSKENEEGIETVMTFPDGFRIVNVKTEQCLGREGKLMGHCVGGYFRDVQGGKTIIYSLRDPKNDPHATIEVTNNKVRQVKGKKNAPPVEKYIPYIKEFLKKLNLQIDTHDIKNMGLIYVNNNLYDVYNLPENLKIKGDLDLSRFPKVTKLPNNLQITGTLILSDTKITEIPKNLKTGDLLLDDTLIKELPDDLDVKGTLIIGTNSEISYIPEKIKFNSLDLYGNKLIEKLPKNLKHINGFLRLNDSAIKYLPENLKIAGDLKLNHCPITHLPDNLEIGGILDLSYSQITELPKNLKIAGFLIIRNTKITRLPDDLEVKMNILTSKNQLKYIPERLKSKIS